MSLQNNVRLINPGHIYKGVLNDRIYYSTSNVLNSLEEKVDWWEVAGKVAGRGKFKHLKTQKEVSDFWKSNGKEATDHGTNLHEMQERYSKEFIILPKDVKYENSIKHIASMFKDYYRSEDECTVYSDRFGVAGTMDKCLFVNKGSNLVTICDYKTAFKTDNIDPYNKDNKFLLHPVSHLQDCKLSRYSLQLSIYGLLAEECCGLGVRDLFIIFIPTDPDMMPYKIHVPYLRTDAINVLEYFSAKKYDVRVINSGVSDLSNEVPIFDI